MPRANASAPAPSRAPRAQQNARETSAVWERIRSNEEQILAVSDQVRETSQQVAEMSASIRELNANDQAHGQRLDTMQQDIRGLRDRQDKMADSIGDLKAGIESSVLKSVTTAMSEASKVERNTGGAIAALRGQMSDATWSVLMAILGGVIMYLAYHIHSF